MAGGEGPNLGAASDRDQPDVSGRKTEAWELSRNDQTLAGLRLVM